MVENRLLFSQKAHLFAVKLRTLQYSETNPAGNYMFKVKRGTLEQGVKCVQS